MNLIIDVGNSLTKLFVVDKNKILHSSNYSTVSDINNLFSLFPRINNGIYSASGENPEGLVETLRERLDNFIIFDSETPIPINNTYASPKTLGADRLAAAIGVNCFFPNTNIIIFDFGTALTIDFVDNENNFLGGNISPGLSVRFKSLNYYTNKLPLLAASEKIEDIGKTTTQAIEAGVVQGIIGEVLHYVYKYSTYQVIFTGGDSFYFAKKIKIPIFVFRNPIVFGLNNVLNYNVST